ncbi:MAG: S41 family peptidase [Bacteroidia bacterium]
MSKLFYRLLPALCAIPCSILHALPEEARLLRFPAISQNAITFSYAGDLYTVQRSGGMARKLTNDVGYECFARYSPDGKTLAFTGQYDGNTEVYKMPAEGGVPVRLTYTATLGRDDVSDRMGPNNIVMTWRDDKSIIYRSRKKTFNDFMGQLFVAHTDGGLSEELPLPCGGNISYNADKKKIAYNRVFREFRTWKYYKGGMADEVWIYDFDSKKIENITNNIAQDIFPMWIGDKIYFCSDRDRTMNLFCYDIATKQTRKVTNFTEYDIKFPSLGNDAIVFENGGFIYVFDLKTETANKVSITIADDFATGRNEMVDGNKFIESSTIAPDGNRLLFTARGDIFTVPMKSGITRNLTKSSNAHDRGALWSPDGKTIAYISDATGEDEIYLQAQDGLTPAKAITKNADTYKFGITWSPDSKKILFNDQKKRLQYVDVNTNDVVTIDTGKTGEINDFWFSPDSKWVVYTNAKPASKNRVYLYEVATRKSTPVTSDWYDSYGGVFSNDGKYLFFVSDRDFNPIYSNTEWNHAYTDMSKIYLITLSNKTASPFAPKNDEVKMGEEKQDTSKADKNKTDDKSKEKSKSEETKPKIPEVKIDFDGIENRIAVLPIDVSGYFGITAFDNSVYYARRGFSDNKTSLKLFDLKEKKETDLGEIDGYEITADAKKMLVIKSKNYYVIDLPRGKLDLKDATSTTDMKVWVDRKAEWNQIFNESWRQMRYFFYDENMHGLNWQVMHDKYQPLVKYVNHRADLTYIIGEMIGELSIGHSYVGGGDKPSPERIPLGLLGAELGRDASGFYKVNKILNGENWTGNTRSPFTEIGVNVKAGDFIIAVNGVPTNTMNDIYASFINTAGKQVDLKINSNASMVGARNVIVTPIGNESDLYYYNWVQKNIKTVNDATNGQVGYLHIPNMGAEGLNEFVKHFYPQLNKKALIIDDRGNGGGNVSPMIIERLNRTLAMISIARNTVQYSNPFQMVLGPKVVLINEYSASDGDLFPYRFQKYKMGKVIGKRSWGGVVGIRGSLPFTDGGYLNRPEFAPYDTDGKNWIIEGHGVDPDIVVDNDPATEYGGTDQQLQAAIKQILEDLKTEGKELPSPPPYPLKNK